MIAQKDRTEPYKAEEAAEEARHERWAHCHINWTAVFIGALATFAVLLLFGLVGTSLGAHVATPEHRIVDVKTIGIWTLIISVSGAFFSAVVGGWSAGKIAGILHSEPAMIHGATTWLVTLPMLVVTAALGAASVFGGWYGGIGANSAITTNTPFVRPDPLAPNATSEEIATFRTQQSEYTRKVQQWHDDTPKVTRNSALVAVTALLLGLLGSVIGGWMASGEPMNFSHHRSRTPVYHQP
jgi:hypothetical protein